MWDRVSQQDNTSVVILHDYLMGNGFGVVLRPLRDGFEYSNGAMGAFWMGLLMARWLEIDHLVVELDAVVVISMTCFDTSPNLPFLPVVIDRRRLARGFSRLRGEAHVPGMLWSD